MKVMKFGGSCLTSTSSLERVRDLAAEAGAPLVLVFSALQGVTDKLLEMSRRALLGEVDVAPLLGEHLAYLDALSPARRREAEARLVATAEDLRRTLLGIAYLQEVSPRTRDRVAAFGERAAVVLAEALLGDRGLPTELAGDQDHGIVTDSTHGDARILEESRAAIRARFAAAAGRIHVVPGFVARDRKGAVTTLGRGGSDYTATYLGAALGCDTVLWKDVEGLMTADPKIVPEARAIERLHYLDALELAHYGTKAIYDRAILPAMRARTRIEIRGFHAASVRSVISADESPVLAITCVRRAIMADYYGIGDDMLRTLAQLFTRFAEAGIYPLLLTEASPRGETSVVLKEDEYPRVADALAAAATPGAETGSEGSPGVQSPEVKTNLGVVSVIGSAMRGRIGFAASIFQCLAARAINIVAIAQTASERNVSVIVERPHVDEAVRALHARFIDGVRP